MSPALDPATFDPGPLADVRAEPDGDRWTVTMVRELAHSPERVWAALTEPDQVRAWAPYEPDRNLALGGDATLTMVDGETRVDLPARVLRAEPTTRLEYTWGDDQVSWQLEPTSTGTRLTLRHTVQGQDWMPRVAAGWHLCLIVAERMLDGDPIDPIVGNEAMRYGWQELHDGYAARLGTDGVTPA